MVLTREHVRTYYDRLGRSQDWMHFCEASAFDELVDASAFTTADAVLELGCGTGRFAARLLEKELPPSALYLGIDLSRTMVELARRRLRQFGDRVEVRLTKGEPRIDVPDGAFDRFVSTYVFDILPDDDIRAMLAEAHRVLRPGGLLCLVSLCPGCTPGSRLVTRAWDAIFSRHPALLGGCRPIELAGFISETDWQVSHSKVVVRCWFPSGVLVATRRGNGLPPEATWETRSGSSRATHAATASAHRSRRCSARRS